MENCERFERCYGGGSYSDCAANDACRTCLNDSNKARDACKQRCYEPHDV